MTVSSEKVPFVELRWQSSFGSWYQVQAAVGKGQHKWVDQGDPVPGTGGEMSIMVEVTQKTQLVRVQLQE